MRQAQISPHAFVLWFSGLRCLIYHYVIIYLEGEERQREREYSTFNYKNSILSTNVKILILLSMRQALLSPAHAFVLWFSGLRCLLYLEREKEVTPLLTSIILTSSSVIVKILIILSMRQTLLSSAHAFVLWFSGLRCSIYLEREREYSPLTTIILFEVRLLRF